MTGPCIKEGRRKEKRKGQERKKKKSLGKFGCDFLFYIWQVSKVKIRLNRCQIHCDDYQHREGKGGGLATLLERVSAPSQRTGAALIMRMSSSPWMKHCLLDAFPVFHTSLFLHLLKARALYPLSQQVLSVGPSARYCSLSDNWRSLNFSCLSTLSLDWLCMVPQQITQTTISSKIWLNT